MTTPEPGRRRTRDRVRERIARNRAAQQLEEERRTALRRSTRPGEPATQDAANSVTWPVRVAAAWSWRLLLIAAVLYVLSRAFLRLELVIVSFVLALFFTAILHPLERLIARHVPGPRSISALLALLIGLAFLAGVGWFVSWQIGNHAAELGDQITDFVNRTKHWLRTGPLHLRSSDLDKLADNITSAVKAHQSQLISGAIETVTTVVEFLAAFLLILLSTFFLLRDGGQVWAWVLRLFPRGVHERVDYAGRVGWQSLGGYMRGQLMIALFHGVAVTVLLFVLKIPLAAALGVLIFLGSFIPLVGLTVAGALCVAVALLEHGATSAIVVGAAIIILVQLESHVLQPFIMSRSVEVHPLAIALSVIAGTTLAGIPGALLAVPFVAFVNSSIRALRDDTVEGGDPFPVNDQTLQDAGPAPGGHTGGDPPAGGHGDPQPGEPGA